MTEEERATWRERGQVFNRLLVIMIYFKIYSDINFKFH